MAGEYVQPEAINSSVLMSLGKLVEMTTFKTNAPLSEEEEAKRTEQSPVRILCVGDYTGGLRTKGMFIRDYLGINPSSRTHPFTCVDFYIKRAKWQPNYSSNTHLWIVAQFCEISEMDRLSALTRVYFRHSHGALVFWGPQNASSLSGALKWRRKIMNEVLSSIPCVLVTDNVPDKFMQPLVWLGPGRIFESEVTLNHFCRDHDFVDCFEITSRDWTSGERSVFGQAVNCLLRKILHSEQKEEDDWM